MTIKKQGGLVGKNPVFSTITATDNVVITTYSLGDIIYASSGGALAALPDVATGNALISGGVGAAPSYGKIGLTTHVSGTLPVANGGTNITSYAVGDILYASAAGVLSSLADIAVGNVLLSGGVGVAPSYGKVGLTTHVSGTLPVANGGTGVTASTGTGSVVLSVSPAFTGQASFADGSAAAPSIAHTGDLNAGLFFPAADTVAVSTAGTQRVTVDPSGNVGIGNSNPTARLEVVTTSGTATAKIWSATNTTPIADLELQRGTNATWGADVYGDYRLRNDSGALLFQYGESTVTTERLRIDASGSVGIGNSAPVTKLHVTGSSITTGVTYLAQPAQTSKAAAATLTIAELLTGIIQYTGAAATLTLPTGASIEGGLPATFPTDMSFDVSFINTGAALLTIGANGNTTVGTMTVATLTSAMLRFRKTAANTYTVYRIS